MKAGRVAICARVSTDTQTTENRLAELRAAAARHGWDVVAEFVDHDVSSAKGGASGPSSISSSWRRRGASSTWLRRGQWTA